MVKKRLHVNVNSKINMCKQEKPFFGLNSFTLSTLWPISVWVFDKC